MLEESRDKETEREMVLKKLRTHGEAYVPDECQEPTNKEGRALLEHNDRE
jgi:hypothetical protein